MTSKTLKVMTAATLAAMISILAIACGNSDAGLSRADVESIARAEMANAPAPDPGLTPEEVAEIAQATTVMASADSVTVEDVQAIVRASLADAAAMTPGNGGLTSADVDAMIQAAVADIPPPVPSAPGLTASDVERIVRSTIAEIPQPPQPEPGLTRAEVEQIARASMPIMPPPIPPEPSLSRAEVAQIAQRVAASIPPRSEQAEYTRFFVENAVAIYEADGLEDTLAYYNTVESIDGQWYVFVIDEDGEVIGTYDPEVIGQNLNGPIGTDANGYNFGPDMLAADENGKWVSYVFKNPATGELGSKHSWVVNRDGLLFGSGWYTKPAEYTKFFVEEAIARYESEGLEDTLAYYNTVESVDGQWYTFIVDEDGYTIGHHNPEFRGRDPSLRVDATGYFYGDDLLSATEDGKWVSYVFNNPASGQIESKHTWAVRHDGLIFGSGWYTEPAEYTKYFLDAAIERYELEGLDATVAHYNSPESVEGSWYIYIADESGEVISHFSPHSIGENFHDAYSIDFTGFDAGAAILAATEEPKWVSYYYTDDETGELTSNHAWVARHEGLIFLSVWAVEPAEYTRAFVAEAIRKYENDGLEDTLAYYNSPESVNGQWYVFIVDEDGYTIGHHNAEFRGRDPSLRVDATGYFYGDDLLSATEDGKWVSYVFENPVTDGLDSKHTWAVRHDGLIFGSGWYEVSQN